MNEEDNGSAGIPPNDPSLRLDWAYGEIQRGLTLGAFSEAERVNLADSAPRAFKAFNEYILTRDQIETELKAILVKSFPGGDSSTFIVQSPIKCHSICPHHFLPVHHIVTYAYQPQMGGKVLGLSKLTRIAQLLSKRAITQEEYNQNLVSILSSSKVGDVTILDDDGNRFLPNLACMAIVSSVHSCMTMRGVHEHSYTTTESFAGSDSLSNESFPKDFVRDLHMRNLPSSM